MSVVKPEGGSEASVKLGQESCVRSSGIITLSVQRPSDGWDKALLRQGQNDQSHWGHQCNYTMLIGESWFHISTPLGIEPGSLMMGSKRVDHWTGPEELCMNTVRSQALHNIHLFKMQLVLNFLALGTFYHEHISA